MWTPVQALIFPERAYRQSLAFTNTNTNSTTQGTSTTFQNYFTTHQRFGDYAVMSIWYAVRDGEPAGHPTFDTTGWTEHHPPTWYPSSDGTVSFQMWRRFMLGATPDPEITFPSVSSTGGDYFRHNGADLFVFPSSTTIPNGRPDTADFLIDTLFTLDTEVVAAPSNVSRVDQLQSTIPVLPDPPPPPENYLYFHVLSGPMRPTGQIDGSSFTYGSPTSDFTEDPDQWEWIYYLGENTSVEEQRAASGRCENQQLDVSLTWTPKAAFGDMTLPVGRTLFVAQVDYL